MQPRSFLTLLLATLVAVIAAIAVLATTPTGGTAVTGGGELAFGQLVMSPQEPNDVLIAGTQGRVHLTRGEGDSLWVLPDKGGYPADPVMVRQLLFDARKLKLAERKTQDRTRLARLWLEDPDAEGSQSLRLTIDAASGPPLADAIIGRTTNALVAGQEGGTYLRYPAEAQAWLAAGKLSLSPDPLDWMDSSLVNLPGDTVRRVTVGRTDAPTIVAERAEGEPTLTVKSGLPEGQVADTKAVVQLASLADNLTFVDVAPADTKLMPPDAVRTTITSFDGIEVRLELAVIDSQPWVRITAALAEEHTTDPAELKGIQAFVDALAAKTAGWAYQLKPAAYQRLAPTAETLVTPP